MTAMDKLSDVLRTPRLRLVPACHTEVDSALAGAGSLAELMGIDAPAGVDAAEFDTSLTRQAQGLLSEEDAEWPFYYVIATLEQGPRLAGLVGYKGTLTPEGAIEIGYAVRADFQGRGIATEATAALIARAFADGRVEAVIAETLAHLLPSIRVLEKLGFVAVAGGSGPEVLRFERRRGPSEARNP